MVITSNMLLDVNYPHTILVPRFIQNLNNLCFFHYNEISMIGFRQYHLYDHLLKKKQQPVTTALCGRPPDPQ